MLSNGLRVFGLLAVFGRGFLRIPLGGRAGDGGPAMALKIIGCGMLFRMIVSSNCMPSDNLLISCIWSSNKLALLSISFGDIGSDR